MYKAKVIEENNGSSISEIYHNDQLLERRLHVNTHKAIYYLRYTKKTQGQGYSEAILLTIDGKLRNLLD